MVATAEHFWVTVATDTQVAMVATQVSWATAVTVARESSALRARSA
jgi:hypothetical protein